MAKEEKEKKASGDGRFKRFFKGIAKWFRDLKSEFKKVSWPTRAACSVIKITRTFSCTS